MDDLDRARRGRDLRRRVLGEEHVEEAESSRTPLNAALQDLITRHGWGEVWSRPGLDLKTRSLLTLGMLIARNRTDEFLVHVRGALRNGASRHEIGEVILHSAIYCGLPAAVSAARLAEETLRSADEPTPP